MRVDVAELYGPAILSDDHKYRYLLTRKVQNNLRTVMFVMGNPSTADGTHDDHTIRKCIEFTRRWGCGRLIVTNGSPLIATDPREVRKAGPMPDQVFRRNRQRIKYAAKYCEMIVIAYGEVGNIFGRGADLAKRLLNLGLPLYHLGTTKSGNPRHPSMLSYVRKPRPGWRCGPTWDCTDEKHLGG